MFYIVKWHILIQPCYYFSPLRSTLPQLMQERKEHTVNVAERENPLFQHNYRLFLASLQNFYPYLCKFSVVCDSNSGLKSRGHSRRKRRRVNDKRKIRSTEWTCCGPVWPTAKPRPRPLPAVTNSDGALPKSNTKRVLNTFYDLV